MKLLSLKIKNFMPYKGEQEIVFPSDSSRNVLLVFGDNMRGKTSFLNAIRWCFFDEALGRNLKVISPLDIINTDAASDGNWSASVHLSFIHEGHEYELKRDLERKKLVHTPRRSSDLESISMLRKDGRVIRSDQIPHELNQVIPKDIARFFLFDGELLQEYETLLNDQSDQGRLIKEAIEKVLGVPAFRNARDHFDDLLRDARKLQSRESKHIDSVKQYSEQIDQLVCDSESLRSQLKELIESKERTEEQKGLIDSEIENAQSTLSAKDRRDNSMNTRAQSLASVKDLEQRRKDLLQGAWRDLVYPLVHVHNKSLEERLGRLRTEQKEQNSIDQKISNVLEIIKSSVCPTCEQEIAPQRKDSLNRQLKSLEGQASAFQLQADEQMEVIAAISSLSRIQRTPASLSIADTEKEMRKLTLVITKLDNEIDELDEELKSHDTAELTRKRTLRDRYIGELTNLERDIREVRSEIEIKERQQALLTKRLEANPTARAQRSSRLASVYEGLRDIFSKSIDALRDDLREQVEEMATLAFSKLTTESSYQGLKINNSYGLTIVDREGRDVPQRSAGAEQIVALALIDGLNRTARKTGPIIMDTPLGRLDLKHRSRVLNYLPEMAEQVILLVHEGEIRKEDVVELLEGRIGGVYNIERVTSSESKLVKD